MKQKMHIKYFILFLFCIILFWTTAGSSDARSARIEFISGQSLIYDGSSEWSVVKQTAVLEKVIKQKPDVILISPTDTKKMIAPLKKAHEQGIKIITLDTYIDDGKYQDGRGEGDFPYAHISSDNVFGGRMAAKALAAAIGGSGTVYVVKGSPASTTEMREYGFKT